MVAIRIKKYRRKNASQFLLQRGARCDDRRGATAVEAAIVLPLISLLLLMCADLGRVIHAQIAVTNAVRAGAEYGASHRFTTDTRQAWEDRIISTMRDEIVSIQNANTNQLVAEISTTQAGPDELRIQVTGTYPFRMIISWVGFPSCLQLSHTVTMRQYQ